MNFITLFNELITELRFKILGYYRYGLMLCQQGEVGPWYGTIFQQPVHDDLNIGAPVEFIYRGAGSYEMMLNGFDKSKYNVILHSTIPGVTVTDGEDGGYLIQTSNGTELANGMLWYTYIEFRFYTIN